jgi:hypothetical protein
MWIHCWNHIQRSYLSRYLFPAMLRGRICSFFGQLWCANNYPGNLVDVQTPLQRSVVLRPITPYQSQRQQDFVDSCLHTKVALRMSRKWTVAAPRMWFHPHKWRGQFNECDGPRPNMASISLVIGMLPHIITVICTKIQFFIPCNTFCYQPNDVMITVPIRHRVMA